MADRQPFDNDSAFMVHGKGDIVEKLRMMEKLRSVVSVTLADEGYKLGTIIVKVFPERDLLALDISADSMATRRMLEAASADCEAMVNGVEARFSLCGFRAATIDGEDVVAATLPQGLFWLQRRSYYRVVVPASRFMKCRIALPNDDVADFPVLNLSLVGIALLDKTGVLQQWGRPGDVLGPCTLRVPGFDGDEFALEVRNKAETTRLSEFRANLRMGLAFREIGRNFEIKLQKLIFEIERELRRDFGGDLR
jgi:c-di-GMP-binding flagellar brake protein YcgR